MRKYKDGYGLVQRFLFEKLEVRGPHHAAGAGFRPGAVVGRRLRGGAVCGLLLEKLPGADARDPDGWNEMCNHEYRFDRAAVETLFA